MQTRALDSSAEEPFTSLERVATLRRSVRHFTARPIAERDMRQILDLGLLAPTSSNMQPFELYWVRSPEKRAPLVAACLDQSAARQAQELVICVARWDRWNATRQEYLAFLETQPDIPEHVLLYYRRLAQIYYGQGPLGLLGLLKRVAAALVGLARPVVRFPVSRNDMRLWAVKSAALVCENIMLAACAKGFDACAMEGNDPVRVGKLLGLSRWTWKLTWDVTMVLAFGYRDEARGLLGARWRRARSNLIKEV